MVGFFTSNWVVWRQTLNESSKYNVWLMALICVFNFHLQDKVLHLPENLPSSTLSKSTTKSPQSKKTFLHDPSWLSVWPWAGSPQHLPIQSTLYSSAHWGNVVSQFPYLLHFFNSHLLWQLYICRLLNVSPAF